jgi:LPS-assembly protein
MKNRFKLNILIITFCSVFSVYSFSDEFIFNTSEINVSEKGNIIEATDGTVTTTEGNFTIKAEKFYYDKEKLILEASKNVEVDDSKNEILIKSDFIKYNSKKKSILSNKKSTIEDSLGNIFFLENFLYTLDNKLIKLGKTKIIDIEKNHYTLEKAFLNLKSKKLLGKDISIDFSNKSFQPGNEPRLKGATITSDGTDSIISKGVFTTCKKNDTCPPWQMSSEKITHNKDKKIIFYKNAWLKIYDTPVFYFPKFFHPDPTVKRQSGFLMPTIMSSSGLGTSLNTPYYHVLGVNKDFTLNPRFYSKNKFLLQTEFREVEKNSRDLFDFSFLNEKDKSVQSHFFSVMKKKINFFNFDESNLLLKIQQASNDNYLKTYKLKSPIIESDTLMHSYLELNAYSDDLSLTSSVEVYEDLNKPDRDRYEYIYPNFNLLKAFKNNTTLDGRFSLNSYGYAKTHDTNISERILVNDLIFNSNPNITKKGFKNTFSYLFKNSNTDSSKSTSFKEGVDNKLDLLFEYSSSYPLIKQTKKFNSTLSPLMTFKYSPNNSKNMTNDDKRLDINNIFGFNRLGTSTSVEGGVSFTYGLDYSKSDKSDNEFLSAKIANIFRPEEDINLPKKSGLNNKTSDFVGQINLIPNQNFKINYDFALKENLADTSYELLGTELKINNFVSTFEYLNEKSSATNTSYFSNESKISNSDNSKSLAFNTRKNIETDVTEFYNLIYEYRNDCLIAALEYNKDYYSDVGLKPEENIFFKLTILPFGQTSSPNLKP